MVGVRVIDASGEDEMVACFLLNRARRALLAATRGYGENRDVFEDFPGDAAWRDTCG
jgi:hypothetical protein